MKTATKKFLTIFLGLLGGWCFATIISLLPGHKYFVLNYTVQDGLSFFVVPFLLCLIYFPLGAYVSLSVIQRHFLKDYSFSRLAVILGMLTGGILVVFAVLFLNVTSMFLGKIIRNYIPANEVFFVGALIGGLYACRIKEATTGTLNLLRQWTLGLFICSLPPLFLIVRPLSMDLFLIFGPGKQRIEWAVKFFKDHFETAQNIFQHRKPSMTMWERSKWSFR